LLHDRLIASCAVDGTVMVIATPKSNKRKRSGNSTKATLMSSLCNKQSQVQPPPPPLETTTSTTTTQAQPPLKQHVQLLAKPKSITIDKIASQMAPLEVAATCVQWHKRQDMNHRGHWLCSGHASGVIRCQLYCEVLGCKRA
jgi:hypothetical protein